MTGNRSERDWRGRGRALRRTSLFILSPALLAVGILLSTGSARAQPATEDIAAESELSGSSASAAAANRSDCRSTPFIRSQIVLGANWSLGVSGRTASLFYAPAQSGNTTWAIGPAVILPAIIGATGGNPWGAGASALASRVEGRWSYGTRITNIWSFGGASAADGRANALTLQPFVTYNAGEGWYATSSPAITANWLAEGGRWSMPLGGSIGKEFTLGEMPGEIELQGSVEPDLAGDGPDWQLRSQLTLKF